MLFRVPWLFLLVAAFLPAQGQQLFDFGPKGGLNRDDLATTYHHEPLIGGNFGLFARVKPPILPGAQGEVLLSSFGSHISAEGYQADLRALTLQLPIFIAVGIGPVELHAGGYYERYLTRSLVSDLELEIEGQTVSLSQLAEDGHGLLFGAGVRLGRLHAGARYNMGMTGLGSAPFLDDVFSRQLQFYLGVGVLGGGSRTVDDK